MNVWYGKTEFTEDNSATCYVEEGPESEQFSSFIVVGFDNNHPTCVLQARVEDLHEAIVLLQSLYQQALQELPVTDQLNLLLKFAKTEDAVFESGEVSLSNLYVYEDEEVDAEEVDTEEEIYND